MNQKVIAVGLALVGLLWGYLAFESFARGKPGIGLVESAAALAFVARGGWEWFKQPAPSKRR